LGLRIARQTTVPDGAPIRDAIAECSARCDVLFVTGGLGPTTDDITREVCAELFGLPLREDPSVVASIRARLEARGYVYRERMGRQAMVPEGAQVLPNHNGTAPGLYFPPLESAWRSTPHLFLLPGPPRELFPMFEDSVMPKLRELTKDPVIRERRLYHVVGLGESAVEEMVGLSLSQRGDLEVGYCARPNEVDLRLIAPAEVLDAVEPLILSTLGKHLVSKRGEKIESWVVAELARRGLTVSTAESCSGGLLAHRLTNIPGASDVFHQGFITYSNAAKTSALGVDPALLQEHGAVSAPVAKAMAAGALEKSGSDFALSLTGIAGPGGDSEAKPVGTVFLGLAGKGRETIAVKDMCPSDRETFKQLATQKALDMLRRALLEG
jgi:nicotinamide-nucleotide amidase